MEASFIHKTSNLKDLMLLTMFPLSKMFKYVSNMYQS